MHRQTTVAILAGFLAFGAASTAHGQTLPVSVELRGGAGIPTGDWNEDDIAETAIGFGAAVKFAATPMVGIYGGWDRFTFGTKEGSFNSDVKLKDSVFRVGADINVPAAALPVAPFVTAGIVYGKTEAEAGSNNWETDSSIGFEGSVGVQFAAGPVAVRPAVGYRSRSVEYPGSGQFAIDETLQYLTFVIGVSLAP